MSRPVSLIRFNLLEEMYNKYNNGNGVPVLRLKRIYDLDITSITLKKYLYYFSLYDIAKGKAIDTEKMLYNSLNPEWRKENTTDKLLKAPPNYIYQGRMPTGQWVKKEK